MSPPPPRFVARAVALAALVCITACRPSVGTRASCSAADGGLADGVVPVVSRCPGGCDDEAARAVVYDATGGAMYAGQALVVGSCAGGGNHCHARDARVRYGVPAGLDFDPIPLALEVGLVNGSASQALWRARESVLRFRDEIWATVSSGAMPPGAAGAAAAFHTHAWVLDPADLSRDIPLPAPGSPEGREILRNWLACGAPIVERWTAYTVWTCARDEACTSGRCVGGFCEPVGDVVPRMRRPVSPEWSALYTQIIAPSCATANCHRSDPVSGIAAAAGLDFRDVRTGWESLMAPASNDPALGAECGGAERVRVVPFAPEQSLLLEKLERDPSCGDPMPAAQPVDPLYVDAIREWIANGAPPPSE